MRRASIMSVLVLKKLGGDGAQKIFPNLKRIKKKVENT